MDGYQSIFAQMQKELEPGAAESLSFEIVSSGFIETAAGLSDEERAKHVRFLDKVVSTLSKLCAVLKEPKLKTDGVDDGAGYEVQVMFAGGSKQWSWDSVIVTAEDFAGAFRTCCFELEAVAPYAFGAGCPEGPFELRLERNFNISRLDRAAVVDCVLVFQSEKDAALLLGRSGMKLRVKLHENGASFIVGVVFGKPKDDPKTREIGRVIGGLVGRIEEIEKELEALGYRKDEGSGEYALKEGLVDSERLKEDIAEWKRKRQAGMLLDASDLKRFKNVHPVPLSELCSQKNRLCIEMEDVYIRLCELQLEGHQFRF